jgi:hypothetical protein
VTTLTSNSLIWSPGDRQNLNPNNPIAIIDHAPHFSTTRNNFQLGDNFLKNE